MYIVCVYNSRIDMCDLIWYNTVYIYTYVYVIGIYIYVHVCVCVRASLKWCVSGTTSLFNRDHDHQPRDFFGQIHFVDHSQQESSSNVFFSHWGILSSKLI
jgi:hypothetical protein